MINEALQSLRGYQRARVIPTEQEIDNAVAAAANTVFGERPDDFIPNGAISMDETDVTKTEQVLDRYRKEADLFARQLAHQEKALREATEKYEADKAALEREFAETRARHEADIAEVSKLRDVALAAIDSLDPGAGRKPRGGKKTAEQDAA